MVGFTSEPPPETAPSARTRERRDPASSSEGIRPSGADRQRRLTSSVPALAIAFGALAAVGCSSPTESRVCLGVIFPALEVEVRDAATGEPRAFGAVVTATSAVRVDTLAIATRPEVDAWMVHGGSGAGEYTVRVDHPGYLTWTASSVRVRQDACGAVTVRLEAPLQPLGS
jgi:hypothetical protein